jgi:hypothetical protein
MPLPFSEVLAARGAGAVRIAVVFDASGDMNSVLAKCGLTPDHTLLAEHGRAAALAILTQLLWKDMAYHLACMPEARAAAIAQELIAQHECAASRYYSNGNFAAAESTTRSWNPLTAATFDSGLIITGAGHQYFCIWFEDED